MSIVARIVWLSACALTGLATLSATAAPPCTADKDECVRWIALGSGARSFVYSTYALDGRNEAITRALIVIHGTGRDVDTYFRTAAAAAFLAGALDDTIVISPRFASNNGKTCNDRLAADEVNWPCNGNSWRSGGVAAGNEALTSFDFMDEILRALARKNGFPSLKSIVVSGHSGGGQFVARYQMANRVHDTLGVPVRYVVANPSSYAYPDANRPVAGSEDFKPFGDAASCTDYDRWPYGLQDRGGYSSRVDDAQLKQQLVARPVTYMAGELDTLRGAALDTTCPAMAQGANRRARAQAFAGYIGQSYGAQHPFMIVRLCGHSARCMFTADAVLPILFPQL